MSIKQVFSQLKPLFNQKFHHYKCVNHFLEKQTLYENLQVFYTMYTLISYI